MQQVRWLSTGYSLKYLPVTQKLGKLCIDSMIVLDARIYTLAFQNQMPSIFSMELVCQIVIDTSAHLILHFKTSRDPWNYFLEETIQ